MWSKKRGKGALGLLFAAVALLVATWAAQSEPARADHVAGATYTGTLSNGGRISITVSADGTRITKMPWSFRVGTCTVINPGLIDPDNPVTVRDHQFAGYLDTEAGVVFEVLVGAFFSGGQLSGTLRVDAVAKVNCLSQSVNLTWTASVSGAATPTVAPAPATLGVTPNSPYAPGANAVVVQGAAPASVVTTRIAAESGRTVLALWLFAGGQWRFFLPQTPTIDGGLAQFAGPLASAYAVLG